MTSASAADSSYQPGPPATLRRELGVFGASMMGLGAILGTGIFVSMAIAAGAAGPAVVLAIVVAALVAICNGLSSAELAAIHPVSGGSYEYGYRWLHPALGFTAGWMFLCAKMASAAAAARGFAGYALNFATEDHARCAAPLALGIVALMTLLVLAGLRRSNLANIVIVSITIGSLLAFVLAGLPDAARLGTANLTPFFASLTSSPLAGFLEACALMFVAYTGYGRVATLGEEIREPRRNIPIAIVVTLAVSMLLYVAVGGVAVAAVGAEPLARATQQAAPLERIARGFQFPVAAQLVAIGAVTAMLGVLLNLILGLSRVVLAMGRRGDLPPVVSKLDRSGSTPHVAVIAVGIGIAALTLIGSLKTTWSFSAFTVLIYYALTNLAALRLSPAEQLYPRFLPALGLAACLFLAFWVETKIWLVGLGLIAAGLLWQQLARRLFRAPTA